MVLSQGEHVKFGPTKWNPPVGRAAPRTTKVNGECCMAYENAKCSMWKDCDESYVSDATFEDLWFAMRGRGGGEMSRMNSNGILE